MNTELQTSKIQQFAQLALAGVEAWIQAGQIVVELIDADPDAVKKICAQCPDIPPDMVLRFDQIGRKLINPALLMCDTPGTKKLVKLPYHLQEKYATEPVELLVMKDGQPDKILLPVKSLTPAQSSQVFSAIGIRSESEQRAYLLDKAAKATYPKLDTFAAYKISKGKAEVHFTERCTLTRAELTDILARMS